MLYSALNFAAGFFGIPYEGQYLQSVTIEANGVRQLYLPVYNNLLIQSIYSTTILSRLTRRKSQTTILFLLKPKLVIFSCPNSNDKAKADRGVWFVEKWANIYLKEAHARLAPQLKGYDLSVEDVYTLQQLCAYEVSIYSHSNFHAPLRNNDRRLLSVIQSSANCSPKKSGRALTTRKLVGLSQ